MEGELEWRARPEEEPNLLFDCLLIEFYLVDLAGTPNSFLKNR